MIQWPHGKRAAFSIIDDTDDAVMPDIARVYDQLIDAGFRTTKTVWVYPVRDVKLFRGASLTGDLEYLNFIIRLKQHGFEIGLHNVGSGYFTRPEIMAGITLFKDLLGAMPSIHVNHSYNNDNIYGGDKRFSFPFDRIVRLLYGNYQGFEGDNPKSIHFWGDVHKYHIRYSRAYELDTFNLLDAMHFPYTDPKYIDYCNSFYPSVFCPNQDLFAKKVTEANIRYLIQSGGCSIIYTHFGYFNERGGVDKRFTAAVKMLKEYESDLWIAPVSEILDHIQSQRGLPEISRATKFRIECMSLWTRLKYRYIVRLDDYHYKKSIGAIHRAAQIDKES